MRLRIDELLDERRWNANQLVELTGIRTNTLYDMRKNSKPSWKTEHLIAIMEAFELDNIDDLIEYQADPTKKKNAKSKK